MEDSKDTAATGDKAMWDELFTTKGVPDPPARTKAEIKAMHNQIIDTVQKGKNRSLPMLAVMASALAALHWAVGDITDEQFINMFKGGHE
jgi:hypothetical protein